MNSRALTLGGAAGIAMPLLFTILGFLQTTLTPGYSIVSQPISALALERLGWLQNLNFILSGVLYCAFALGLRSGLAPHAGIGPWLHFLAGIGLMVLGVFPWTLHDGEPTEPLGHTIGVFLAFLPAAVGWILISRPMAKEPAWRSLATFSLLVGILMIVIFFAFGALAEGKDAPLHPWEGVFQRALANLWLLCTFILALRLMRLGRTASYGRRPS